jgi:hypothetical protein
MMIAGILMMSQKYITEKLNLESSTLDSLTWFLLLLLFIFAILGFELRASYLLGRWSTTWATLPAFNSVSYEVLTRTFFLNKSTELCCLRLFWNFQGTFLIVFNI